MQLVTNSPDPFCILSSTKYVLENAQHVSLEISNIQKIAKVIKKRIDKGLMTTEENSRTTGNFRNDIQLIFIEDIVNYCFWLEKNKPRWTIEWPKNNLTYGGWFTLLACFERAFAEQIPILNTDFLVSLPLQEVKHIFRSATVTEIPLIETRLHNLREAGKVLQEKFDGHFQNVLEAANNNAIQLVELIYKNFSSFRDTAIYKGKDVYFFKRAQICAHDISLLLEKNKKEQLKNLDQLTAFADYKLPQMLRMFGLITYDKPLAEKIDNYILLPSGGEEEIEIRAATIWSVELLKQYLQKYTASQIDNALWLLSQKKWENIQPYHRTRTIYY